MAPSSSVGDGCRRRAERLARRGYGEGLSRGSDAGVDRAHRRRAFSSISSYSSSGSDCDHDRAAGADRRRLAVDHDRADRDAEVAAAAEAEVADRARVDAARLALESSMISIVRSFGAPVIEPGGKQARTQSGGSDAPRAAGRGRSRRAGARSRRSRPPSAPGTCTLPTSQTRPRSLRSRSTIIRFSARFFSSARELRGQARVLRRRRRRGGWSP